MEQYYAKPKHTAESFVSAASLTKKKAILGRAASRHFITQSLMESFAAPFVSARKSAPPLKDVVHCIDFVDAN